jgi:hypothetical protein
MYFVCRDKLNSHAPPLISGKHFPKLFQAQFLFVDFNNERVVLTAPDQTAQDTSAWNPLIASSEVFDLR